MFFVGLPSPWFSCGIDFLFNCCHKLIYFLRVRHFAKNCVWNIWPILYSSNDQTVLENTMF